ncbi:MULTISPECIES: zinc-dependent dehydrogenase [Metallosphaera]|uniref:Alcohol dehydrogenase GroES domain protein n=3 Tax=Metallosphaera TaxID=41980 RepID=A4YD71_METS5|nr:MULTISPECIES: zinc-dependent dehydrogenase [Metallosphaera]ABP94373.1 Alcohol dehydrogenase GroES domain protein [Metallosphaera sedula DSM 5348]AIM26360.1 Alcohol dehydrogenase GroES domain protein [Metallosphaera sedula]AKV73369.1 alcohol dehydrogenase [Metallosphaera sedula]AKV75613.1 alcohol dehydrogenase [Metallosphaera sedula]AKV77859.1 alcohol dehydrogenase [Metallosphaera sedula]
MKAIIMEGGKAVLKEVPIPKLGQGDVLVEMKACGLCGTDIEKMCGQYTASQPILGHEPAGVVAESMSDAVKPGDRVFAHHHVPCYECYYCKKGSPTMCPYYRKTNLDPGGFAEFFRVPAWNVEKGGILVLPSNVSFEEGSFVEPLATVVRAQRRVGISRDDSVLIVGAGPMGLLHLLKIKDMGVSNVIISDVSEYRLNFAESLGASLLLNPTKHQVEQEAKKATDGRGVDVAIIASGAPQAILSGLNSVRKGGRVLLFGVPYKGTILNYDISELLNNEISVIPSNAAVEEDTREALKLISERRVDVRKLVTHRYDLEQFHEAVRVAKQGNAIKVVITS